jgi:hypothetical protein
MSVQILGVHLQAGSIATSNFNFPISIFEFRSSALLPVRHPNILHLYRVP